MDISIITVTHGRRALLQQKLASLLQQTLEPHRFEWLVCVNEDIDGTKPYLESLSPPFSLKHTSFLKQQAPGTARNACVNLASGRILYFSDDDCLLAKETLERHLKVQEQACVAIGPIRFEAATTTVWKPKTVQYWNLNGANSSLPKAAFDAVGGFDENLQGYGGEDLLLGYLLHKQGLPFKTIAAEITHLGVNPMLGRNLEKAFSAGRNATRIAKRYPELAFRLGVHPALLAVKRLILWPLIAPLLSWLLPDTYPYETAYFQGAELERKSYD